MMKSEFLFLKRKNINIFHSVAIKGSLLYLFEIDIFVSKDMFAKRGQCGKINIIYRYIYIY